MDSEIISGILDAGRQAAVLQMEKESEHFDDDKADLYRLLATEAMFLWRLRDREVHITEKTLETFKENAGSIIAFASLLVSEYDRELEKICLKNSPSLFDKDE